MDSINHSLAIVPYVGSKQVPDQTTLLYEQERLEKRMQSVMDRSFKAQIQDNRYFHKYGMGDIVVLVGTSTAGKTSIIKALRQLESDRIEDGGDLRVYTVDVKIFKKRCPQEMEFLEQVLEEPSDISKAVFSKERHWKNGISSQAIVKAEEAIKHIKETIDSLSKEEQQKDMSLFREIEPQMFDEAFEHSRRGENIIFDVLNIDNLARHMLLRNFDGPMRIVLTYCPFYILSSRMEKRNKEAKESGELSNQRIGEFPLVQFSEIYTQKEKDQLTFEKLTRDQVTKAFDENFDKGIDASRKEGRPLPSNEQILIDKETFRQKFLENLGFKDGVDLVEIAPRNQRLYHLIINSSQLIPEQSAKILHEGTYKR